MTDAVLVENTTEPSHSAPAVQSHTKGWKYLSRDGMQEEDGHNLNAILKAGALRESRKAMNIPQAK